MAENPLVRALEDAVQAARSLDGPLSEQLQFIADRVRSLSDHFADAVERMIGRQQAKEAGCTAPMPGEMMPPFLLPDDAGSLVAMGDLLEQGPLVISFNRGHWCPYCRLNVMALADAAEAVERAGARLVAITPERRKFTKALKADANAGFPILTDLDNGYALMLNLAIWVGAEMEELIGGAGWNLPDYQGNQAWMLPVPATFVVDESGLILARYVDPDYRRRMEIEDLVAALRAITSRPIQASPVYAAGSAA